MGEIKIIIWIVLGIIYLISRARKKSTPDSAPSPVEEYQPEEKPVTFEELLKEIQGAKAAKQPPQQVLEPIEQYKTDYDDNLKEEEQPLEKVDYSYRNQDSIYETYEKAKQEAFYRPSMEETLKLENTVVRFGQFKGYEQQLRPSLAAMYGKELSNATNFRKAFILSEILNKRF